MKANSPHSDTQKVTPWGFWATVGFSSIIVSAWVTCWWILHASVTAVAKTRNAQFDVEKFRQSLDSSHLFPAVAQSIAGLLAVGLILLFVKLRRNITLQQYLCLYKPRYRGLTKWLLILLLWMACGYVVSLFLEDLDVEYSSISFSMFLLFFVHVVVVAPCEEIFYRGFMFKGIEDSKVGPVGAVIITALAWSASHTQYDVSMRAGMFVAGLLLGYARLKSGSIYVPIAMHILVNAAIAVRAIIESGPA